MQPANKITLIIGAGASKAINSSICTGQELITDIANRVTDRNTPGDQHLSKNIPYPLELKIRFLAHIDNYINSVESPSIDEFLNEINSYPEYEPDREAFLSIGYSMILAHVYGFEGSSTQKALFSTDTWLTTVSKFIDENGILVSDSQDKFNIITFNYDRIIEYYLLKRYDYSDEIINFVNKNVYHVYGRVGCLEKLKPKPIGRNVFETNVEFGRQNHELEKFTKEYAGYIKTLYDKRIDTGDLKDIMKASDKICVFGYGFDSINNRRLGLQNCFNLGNEFKVNIYSGEYPNFNFPYRRRMAEIVRSLIMEADIYYESCSQFLEKNLAGI